MSLSLINSKIQIKQNKGNLYDKMERIEIAFPAQIIGRYRSVAIKDRNWDVTMNCSVGQTTFHTTTIGC